MAKRFEQVVVSKLAGGGVRVSIRRLHEGRIIEERADARSAREALAAGEAVLEALTRKSGR